MYNNLAHFIEILEKEGELVRIKEYVSPELEMTEIYDRVVKNNGKALLFENTGYSFPVLLNAFGSEKRICLALGIMQLESVEQEIKRLFEKFASPQSNFLGKIKLLPELGVLASYFPKVKKGKGKCQQVIYENPDLSILPILKCWPYDGGKFITLPIVHTKDPHTNIRNVGMYRMQVFDGKLTGMHWHLHKNSARHYNEFKKLNRRMPVSIALGGDPVYAYVATAPLPDQIDEYIFAGFLRKKKVELVKCITNDIEVPADSDIIIEGYVDPDEELILEGPFGDHTGFYSLEDFYPRFHVTCISHKKEAVYPATVVGIASQEDQWLGKATERIFLAPIKLAMQPEIIDMELPSQGGFHNVVVVKIKKEYPGQGLKIINSLWGMGQMMFSKTIIVVDENTDIKNAGELLKSIEQHVQIPNDLIFSKGPLDALDHSSNQFAFGSKWGIDATVKCSAERPPLQNKKEDQNHETIQLPDFVLSNKSIGKRIEILALRKTKKDMDFLKIHAPRLFPNKFVIVVDDGLDIHFLGDVLWYASHNIDPERDCTINGQTVFIDGTRKNKPEDGFCRDWPNVITMSDEIINKINKIWDSLKIGDFLPSPSLKYKNLVRGNSARVSE